MSLSYVRLNKINKYKNLQYIMKNTKLNLVVKTKDGAKASKIVGLLSKFLKSVDIPCRFELPNDKVFK